MIQSVIPPDYQARVEEVYIDKRSACWRKVPIWIFSPASDQGNLPCLFHLGCLNGHLALMLGTPPIYLIWLNWRHRLLELVITIGFCGHKKRTGIQPIYDGTHLNAAFIDTIPYTTHELTYIFDSEKHAKWLDSQSQTMASRADMSKTSSQLFGKPCAH